MFNLEKSQIAFEEAKEHIPGGVNSPVRSYRSVGSNPPFIARAEGSRIYDIDGNEYIDYVLSWGPMILGHAHPRVVVALQEAVKHGTSYGAPTTLETMVATKISEFMPNLEMVRMVNSGTEATMSALRLARGFTGRDKIVKFIGCYHGHSDSLLVKAGSGLATFGVPDSPGVPTNVTSDTLTCPYNDFEAIKEIFVKYGSEIAAVIVEPVAGNMGCVPPTEGYLKHLRQLTTEYGALLIFDEVMCGFRASRGGAQELYDIKPDLTCLGKIIGGGLPMAAFGGKREIMEYLAPKGPVYQAGTLSGNPVAMTAGLTTLEILAEDAEIFAEIEQKTHYLCQGLRELAAKHNVPVVVQQLGSMFTLFFTNSAVTNFAEAEATNDEAFKIFFHENLKRGIYYAPSRFESNFMSYAHSQADLDKTLMVADQALACVREHLQA